MTSKSRPTEATYTTAQLPELLRSSLIGGAVAHVLDLAARNGIRLPEGTHEEVRAAADPLAAIYTTTAQEIRDWHTPKPRPADLNGGQ